ncbi:TetR/AcrR family transcriptional regulator [Desulfonema ishimotonii]|uniref:TetR/AcrR family transcriptional regulator n=1 Tax=Desulfonema ishimotonii TaxID=45657 RepID=A0A401FX66_9BACT|nr:TetR/AcrR family transcriptional regulator [Desulfonema ishimotonii]GBC61546.1 TetR/AcrR family transcriptional regulator [Desulfonema ishimotonii]
MTPKQEPSPWPPGRIKIVRAFKMLLEDKNFHAITTAEIARTAGVTEGLIYKYFRDKRDLLYQVLKAHFEKFLLQIERDLRGIDGAVNKLRKIIWSNLDSYANHRVFARIILLEVRNSPDYFESEAYELVRQYNRMILGIIREGVRDGEIKEDIAPSFIRHAIFGAIEHACLNGAIFNRALATDPIAENICRLIFTGIVNRGKE